MEKMKRIAFRGGQLYITIYRSYASSQQGMELTCTSYVVIAGEIWAYNPHFNPCSILLITGFCFLGIGFAYRWFG